MFSARRVTTAAFAALALGFTGRLELWAMQSCFDIQKYSPKGGHSGSGGKCLKGFLKQAGNLITFGLTTSTCWDETWIEPGGTKCVTGAIYTGCQDQQTPLTIITTKQGCDEDNNCVPVGQGQVQVIQITAQPSGQCGSGGSSTSINTGSPGTLPAGPGPISGGGSGPKV